MTKRRLRVVATPIGNLADMSPRAAEALRGADLILCEDTRHSAPLVKRTGAQGRLLSCHAHNEKQRIGDVVAALESGASVALITDAGAPALSDPGGRLVEGVIAAGHDVEVIPGPSALVAAIMGAGIDTSKFAFLGFLPKSRAALLESVARAGLGVVVYEAPQRAAETLVDLFEAFGARRVVVARELTKVHETFHRGVLGGALSPPLVERGELVIVVEAGAEKLQVAEEAEVAALARDRTLPPKERAKRVAKATGISVKDAYSLVAKPSGAIDRVLQHLAEAARALIHADARARARRGPPPKAREVPEAFARDLSPRSHAVRCDIDGADALMDLLAQGSALHAPVEAKAAAEALLAALERVDALKEALKEAENAPSTTNRRVQHGSARKKG